MRTRKARLVFLFFLLIVGAGAAVFTAYQARHLEDIGRAGHAIVARVDQLAADSQKVGDAQQAYVISSGIDRPTPEQVPMLIAAVVNEGGALEPQLRAARAVTELKTFLERAHALERFEAQAQDHVQLGQELMAADVISVEARDALAAMNTALRDIRSAEDEVTEAERMATLNRVWMAAGGAGVVWMLGLFLLVGAPRARAIPQPSSTTTILPIAENPNPRNVTQLASPDLAEAADLCTAIARTTDANELPVLLTRASTTLGASGVVVWMAAGDELIAASAHGYDARAFDLLGPIKRSAQNATAAAWRLGSMQVVPSGETSNGALVAPLLGIERCVGVLAVEVPRGREADPAVQAMTRILAAQFAATLAPWPAASVAETPFRSLDKAAEG
jgi:hypothetical protein